MDVPAVVASAVSAVTCVSAVVGFAARSRANIETLTQAVHDLKGDVDSLKAEAGGGNVSRADMLARLNQVESNARAVNSLGERITKLETAFEIQFKSISDKLDRLDRGMESINRMASSAIRSATRGGVGVLPPDIPD